jgi:DNA-directed RNA polymerase subunit M/transcription elongation factor TFIIS
MTQCKKCGDIVIKGKRVGRKYLCLSCWVEASINSRRKKVKKINKKITCTHQP